MVIRPTASPAPPGTILNLVEVQLYGAGGALIDRSRLSFQLSSTYVGDDGIPAPAGLCNDGRTTDGVVCHTAPDDKDPRLTISYSCALGSLSKIVVTNRQGSYTDRINAFSLDVVSVHGFSALTHAFAGGAPSYTIAVPGGKLSGICVFVLAI